ncbi:unnamed protein product [Durusdinium trenchii]|uniref:RRM domain-containing protein n=1 Tax=Durusdinium trenchii TaxID=1381693 RepID=A0ABP0RCL5_9DINO
MAAKGDSGTVGKRSAADILAAFRSRVDRQIAGESDQDAKEEYADGTTFFLTTSAAVRRRKEAEEKERAQKDLEVMVVMKVKIVVMVAEAWILPGKRTANGRGRKRLAHELEATSRPLTALELLCQQLPPPEPKPRKREDKVPRQLQEEVKDEVEKVKTAWKKPKRKAKVMNVPASLQFKYLKELLEKATGPIVEGYIDEAFTAWLAFERAEDAEGLYNDFNGGEISGESIEVQLLSDSEPLGRA